MALSAGTCLGPYQILALIGVGGMGEVYKALDPRLRRTVAIKVLRSHVRGNPERRQRFEREARIVAALEHPHICVLHDVGRQDGIDFFVTEYLDGETLADRLKRGPLPLDQVLTYAIEITDALDKAHRKGVVHRDLKPANIMLTKSGAKLLDFGLAKLRPQEGVATDGLTGTTAITAPRAILGTLHYMAPEQLAGQEADARSDLFALGVVLYQMIAGNHPFEAETRAGIVASILDRDPPSLHSTIADPDSGLDWVVTTCLRRSPDERWQSAADVLLVLRSIRVRSGARTATEHPLGKRSLSQLWAPVSVVGVLAIALIVLLPQLKRPTDASLPTALFSIQAPEGTSFGSSWTGIPSLAPDGSRIVFAAVSRSDGQRRLWLAPLSPFESQVIPGTEGASAPFWSPDSSSLAFFAQGKLKRVGLRGDPHIVADAGDGGGGTWSRDGTIVFAPGTFGEGRLFRVSGQGGPVVGVTTLDQGLGETNHVWPQFLPDGRRFVYTAFGSRASGVYAGSLDSSERTRLVLFSEGRRYSAARYTTLGYLLFTEDQTLRALRMDTRRLGAIGASFPVANDIAFSTPAQAAFSLSDNGVLSYKSGEAIHESELVWSRRDGTRREPVGPRGAYGNLSLSPDESSVALERFATNGQRDIWVMELKRGSLTRFTHDGASRLPIWGLGGDILFGTSRVGPRSLHAKSSSGGEERVILSSNVSLAPTHWSLDGQLIIYQAVETTTKRDLWVLPLKPPGKAQPILQSAFNESQGRLSPNGRWLAYVSDESERNEVHLCSFPDARNREAIGAGVGPMWARDGSELYYISAAHDLMSVSIAERPRLSIGPPQVLFHAAKLVDYAPSRDGHRFLLNVANGPITTTPITVVVNWVRLVKE